ncbi:MAG TPA: hypothetical protein VHA52_11605 [Candidatus Babeliaceae bacterium]|nr:hypothetical protein [Candidatus Babeliaceae bacterium]
MHPATKAAVYVKGSNTDKIQIEIAKLNEYLMNDGCMLADANQVYVDSKNSLKQLKALVKHAKQREIQVVYVVHDLLAGERDKYRTLINELYVQGISILVCE